MANVFYLRIRGKSQGPYSLDQLRGFARRGQLSRLHEVSNDCVTWGRASAYPELFVGGGDSAAAAGAQSAGLEPLGLTPDSAPERRSADGSHDIEFDVPGGDYVLANGGHPPARAAGQAPPGQAGSWYYTAGGKQCGPVDRDSLQRMIAGGQVGPHEQVWTEGMPQWQNVQQVPGVAEHVGIGGVSSWIPSGPTSLFDFTTPQISASKYCPHCGQLITSLAEICPKCGVRQFHPQTSGFGGVTASGKSRIAAALFAFFLGGIGVHKFYLGEVAMGVFYLLFCWTFIPGIIALIEAIILLTMSEQQFARKYG